MVRGLIDPSEVCTPQQVYLGTKQAHELEEKTCALDNATQTTAIEEQASVIYIPSNNKTVQKLVSIQGVRVTVRKAELDSAVAVALVSICCYGSC